MPGKGQKLSMTLQPPEPAGTKNTAEFLNENQPVKYAVLLSFISSVFLKQAEQ